MIGAGESHSAGWIGRLLVVDDDLMQRSVIGKIGENLGYDTFIAPSFEVAAAMLQRDTFDVMALDLRLGERDGVELLRLAADRGLHAMPIVIISGCDDRVLNSTRRVAEALKLSIAGCLAKPLRLQDLREALQTPHRSPTACAPGSLAYDVTPEKIAAGLARGEFYVELQPKIELESGKIVGAEALARWHPADFGLVPPAQFIPIAEKSGLITELTDHVLVSAMARGRKLIELNPDFSIAVNVSGCLMSDLTLPERFDEILRRHGIPQQSLIVEITETAAAQDIDRAIDILVRLRLKNIGTSLDDFGTGYSSLAALARLPFSELKIDQSFVRGSEADTDMMKIVNASVALGRSFNMKVVAEGVENARILALMRLAGCDMGQGYVFARPMKAEHAESWLSQCNSAVVRQMQGAPKLANQVA